VAEGAAAVAVAGVATGRVPRGYGPLVVVLTGRNIALPRLAAVLAG
jgi:threonine dehydratase